ncbi:MAG: thiamine pyrophosphate-dependent dehydrogenase E1 component subunit alpha [Microbacteriaceae bacterium]|jgi:pyruvate dehydrogenase E1 component alpha subunit|nr:thiamine pyrophosphate-dependent dehydrogenase E1 component subunit alpha [Microbacteriaceae bacterium]MBT5575948.1 thiamine pyrophosphate-dependent dehydrogenase E1 component subunit alpha [Microbacteriaceae bacterium]
MVSVWERFGYMVWMREFELACLEGVPTREIHGELHTAVGQEAIGAGLAGFLRADDALASTHRNHLHAIAKGVDMRAMLAEIFEKETGLCGGFGGHMHLFDASLKFSATGIVGAGLPVVIGHAWAARLRGSDAVAVAVVGDGAVNTGAFHEALNMAGVHRLPVIVVVENNEWAISVPFHQASATATIAERAPAWSAHGVRVDGTDVEAVADAFGTAVQRAREGGGPTLIEATCYRFRGHFEGDADTYRTEEEKERRRKEDPLVLTAQRLISRGVASAEQIDSLRSAVTAAMADLLASVRADRSPDPATALRHVFVEVA